MFMVNVFLFRELPKHKLTRSDAGIDLCTLPRAATFKLQRRFWHSLKDTPKYLKVQASPFCISLGYRGIVTNKFAHE